MGSKPPSTLCVRKRKTPLISWINFVSALLRGGGCVLCRGMLCLCPIIWFGVWVGLILNLDGWGMPKMGEGFGNVPGHQDVNFLGLIIPFYGKSTVLLPLPIAQAFLVLPHSV